MQLKAIYQKEIKMKATEILMQEHRVIEAVLDAIDGLATKAEQVSRLDGDDARDAVSFVRNFADHCHHSKEEGILFPAMVEKGIPQAGGPIGAMLQEHEISRAHVKGMDEQIEAAEKGNLQAVRLFAEQARGYTSLLRQHINKEDHVLYRLAEQVFDDDDEKRLLAQYDHVENDHVGTGEHEKYLELGRRLARNYVEPGRLDETIFDSHKSGCCHGHQ